MRTSSLVAQLSLAVCWLALACGDATTHEAPEQASPAPTPEPAPVELQPLEQVQVRADVVYEAQGSRMYLNPADTIVSRVIARDGIWEPLETEVFRSKVGPGDVVVDVGANLGYYTLLAARLVGNAGHVYAFEPDPESFALLERNVALNGYENVTAVPLALGRAPGKLQLFLNAKNRGDHRVYDPTGKRRSVDVDVVTLDAYLKAHEVPRVDFLKIDTQGAECLILEGARKTVADQAGLTLVLEFTPHFLAAMGQDPRTCFAALAEPRFRLHDIDEWGRKLEPTDLDTLLTRYSVESKKFTNVLVEPVEG